MVHGLSCSEACGIFPDQGWNLCLQHWQVDSLPLSHQGSQLHKGNTQTQEGFYAFSSCRLITSEKITKVTNTESLPLPNYCITFLSYLCSGDDICVGGYHVIGLLSLSPS